ncbi:hypothetical protein SUGI_0766490 [Cryptomeria japonica]|uniref:uncharacterized protein LOC131078516 n=1 Tax=Cryptomeria japonica TaxID=3369 RepID=UPI0024149D37|nr:uncharacterized protein LOC131078516 [Cryptomeria japonica]GLJ37726.1 hypothetical protein SUGI_0766490 [Cryptomeria japonica]
MELQTDLLPPSRLQIVGISMEQHQNKENSPPFLFSRSAVPFSTLQFLKRRPLHDITHLFSTNTSTESIHNGRGMVSEAVEPIAGVQNRKRKSTNLSSDSNTSIPNLKRPSLRTDFR